jgi:solute carrier family 39 (zinc transporter), member 1/2/3
MSWRRNQLRAFLLLAVILLITAAPYQANAQPAPPADPTAAADTCADPSVDGACRNVPKALRLKLIAIPTILVSSVIGVCLPLLSRSVPALRPDRNLFVIVKAFASGVILATGYMHVLPDSFSNLTSPCLPRKPWADFSFTTFVAMLAALFTLMVDSLMLSFYNRRKGGNTSGRRTSGAVADHESPAHEHHWHSHGHGHGHGHAGGIVVADKPEDDEASQVQLRRNRVVVQVFVPTRSSSTSTSKVRTTTFRWPIVGLAATFLNTWFSKATVSSVCLGRTHVHVYK